MSDDQYAENYESKEKDTNWNVWYLVVFALLVLQIIFYYLITKHFQ